MPVNADKPDRWKADIARSVDFFNDWFMQFAPKAYRDTRVEATRQVEIALARTGKLTNIEPVVLQQNPSVLPILRMATAPPIARDRLVGLAGVSPNLVKNMEIDERMPPRMSRTALHAELRQIADMIMRLVDKDIFPWLEDGHQPSQTEVHRAAPLSQTACAAHRQTQSSATPRNVDSSPLSGSGSNNATTPTSSLVREQRSTTSGPARSRFA
jgi:hypothetical protein